MLMVNKTTSFKKKGRRDNFKKGGKRVATPAKKSRKGPKSDTDASTTRELDTGSGTAPSIWQTRRLAPSNKVYLIYTLLMCI